MVLNIVDSKKMVILVGRIRATHILGFTSKIGFDFYE